MRIGLFFAALLLAISPAKADELRPAFVELTQQSKSVWKLLWKASAQSRLGFSGQAVFPQNCTAMKEVAERKIIQTNIIRTRSLRCDGTINGGKVGLKGLEFSKTDALVRIAPLNGEVQNLRLTPDEPIVIIAEPEQISNVAATYTFLGIEHILLGFDHLLFVLALVLLIKGGWNVAKTVTAFTLAHSITLVGTTLGFLSLPQRPVEAVIALSIVFLAVEIVKAKPEENRLSERFPWIVAFLFGLLHGFGFAGALAEIGLPAGEIPMALVTFNVGVEIGQLMIVAVAIILLTLIHRFNEKWIKPTRTFSAYFIGILATYWFVERMVFA